MITINKKEIEKFSQLAEEWWNPNGKFAPLHKFNPVRIDFVREKLVSYFKLNSDSNEPLKNIDILDIGCGGGLLSEPMKRLGANITGIDASKKNIEIAKLHAKQMNLKINYLNSTPEELKIKNKFDVILNMEVVEHVSSIDYFIQHCSKILKKGGIMFVATINKTLKSYLEAIVGAEYILRWLPIGTHNWDNFIKPNKLKSIARNNGFENKDLIGVKFNPFTGKWKRSPDISVNYISTFLKS